MSEPNTNLQSVATELAASVTGEQAPVTSTTATPTESAGPGFTWTIYPKPGRVKFSLRSGVCHLNYNITPCNTQELLNLRDSIKQYNYWENQSCTLHVDSGMLILTVVESSTYCDHPHFKMGNTIRFNLLSAPIHTAVIKMLNELCEVISETHALSSMGITFSQYEPALVDATISTHEDGKMTSVSVLVNRVEDFRIEMPTEAVPVFCKALCDLTPREDHSWERRKVSTSDGQYTVILVPSALSYIFDIVIRSNDGRFLCGRADFHTAWIHAVTRVLLRQDSNEVYETRWHYGMPIIRSVGVRVDLQTCIAPDQSTMYYLDIVGRKCKLSLPEEFPYMVRKAVRFYLCDEEECQVCCTIKAKFEA